MPLYRTQVSWAADMAGGTLPPKDFITVTPWFNDHGPGTNPMTIAGDLCDVFAKSSTGWAPYNMQITTSVYLHVPGQLKDGPPVAKITKNAGVGATSACPREVAICLSFYAGQNQPGRRGRLFLPVCLSAATVTLGVRPDTTLRTKVVNIATALAAIGGVDVDWVVHSKKADASYAVTNAWCDDEWDTVRSRGLKPSARTLLTVAG